MSGGAVPGRIRWAVGVVDPGPAERLLEIGCGPGVAAALVCERLSGGRLLAVDRSPVAVSRTLARNAHHVRDGRLAVRQSTLAGLDVAESAVDKAFSVNVNVFWTARADRELSVLGRALRAGGRLCLLYDSGGDRVTAKISAALRENGFTEVTVLRSEHGIGVTGVRA